MSLETMEISGPHNRKISIKFPLPRSMGPPGRKEGPDLHDSSRAYSPSCFPSPIPRRSHFHYPYSLFFLHRPLPCCLCLSQVYLSLSISLSLPLSRPWPLPLPFPLSLPLPLHLRLYASASASTYSLPPPLLCQYSTASAHILRPSISAQTYLFYTITSLFTTRHARMRMCIAQLIVLRNLGEKCFHSSLKSNCPKKIKISSNGIFRFYYGI